MHRLFRPALVLVILALLVQGVSLLGLRYVTSDRSVMLQLQDGQIGLWRAQPGTFDFVGAGLSGARGYSGVKWSFDLKRNATVYVPPGPGQTFGKKSSWTGAAAPALLAIVVPAIVLAAPPVFAKGRRIARLRRGACVRCGYDLHELAGGRCPECGLGSSRVARAMRALHLKWLSLADRLPAPPVTAIRFRCTMAVADHEFAAAPPLRRPPRPH